MGNRFLAVVILLASISGVRAAEQAAIPPAVTPVSELATLVDRFNLDRGSLFRRYDVEYSPERYARFTKFYQDWQQELARLKFDSLGVEGRIDHTLLKSRLEYELRLLAREQKWVSEAASLVPFSATLTGLLEARGRLESMDAKKTATILDTLTADIELATVAIGAPARVAVVAGIADPVRARQINAYRAAEILSSLRTDLTAWNRYYSGYDPMYTWWAARPHANADQALAAYIKVLREKIVGYREGDDEPIIGNPIGKAALVEDLASEFIPYTPEDLLAIAEREFAWCDREMLKASRDMGFGDNWRAALEKVKTLHAEPGKQTDLVRDQAREAVDYVTKRDLVTVPPLADEGWRMTMMSPERQKVNPFFLGGEVIQVSFPTDAMDQADKLMSMRGNNIHFSRSTVFHELIPGHGLQQFMTARYNPHRRAFGTPFWTEGWSLYWEMFLWDDGFPKTPENRVGMLFWRMHRQARIIFSLRFHLGTMTPQECIDFLVERVGHERANAEAEVRRSFNGTYPPLYQLAYMIGGMQFRAMQAELVGSKKMTNKQYHDAVLQAGSMPVELVRASLTKQLLPANFATTWKFDSVTAR
jgi:uncharacterized protein (DUF885 family)